MGADDEGDDRFASDTDRSPGDTFALVGNEIRAGILRTLGEAREPMAPPPRIAFSELREAVDADVPSSQFNYHLQQLVGQFVERTDRGYRLRPAGTALYRAVMAETFHRDASLDAFEVGLDCYHCGTAVTGGYEGGYFSVSCPGCGYSYFDSTRVPPSGVEETDELLDRVVRHDRHKLLAFSRGVCPVCATGLDRSIVDADDAAFSDNRPAKAFVFHACDHCGNQDYRTVGEALLLRPPVVCFFAERGLDVTTTPAWELEFAATDRHLRVDSTDPWRLTLSLERAGDVRELAVDGDLSIVERRDNPDEDK